MSRYKYLPTKEAEKVPRWTKVDGISMGIGGDVTLHLPPPNKKRVIPEATPDQYRKLFEMGCPLVEKKVIRAKTDKSDTSGN